MKKTFLMMAMAAASMAASAQTLIKANFEQGDSTVYATAASITVNAMTGQTIKCNMDYETQLVVKSVTPDSMIIESLITNFKVSGDEEAAGELAQVAGMMKDFKTIVSTDGNGKLRHIINLKDIKEHASKFFAGYVDKMFAEHPEIAQFQTKEKMAETMNNLVTEESLLDQMDNNGIFALYGKNVKTGDTEAEETQGIKYKTTYTVTPLLGKLTVVANSVADMSAEDTKAMFFAQMEKAGLPEDQLQMIKQNYDQMVAMGLTKFDMTNNATYLYGKNSWPQEIKVKQDGDTFGQKVKNETTSTCKFTNRK